MFKKLLASFTPRERTIFFAIATLCGISGMVLVFSFIQNSTRLVPDYGGSYTEGVVGQPTFINPVLSGDDVNEALVHLAYTPLADLAEKIEADPLRATRAWTVRIREGATWQDNEKITSDDIVFTIKKIQDPSSQSPLAFLWQGVSVNRLSEREVVFTLPAPYASFKNVIETLYIVPKHSFADVPPANWRFSKYNLEPIGNGPYRVSILEKRPDGFISSIRLVRNTLYPAGAQPEGENSANASPGVVLPHSAYLDMITIKFFANTGDLVKAFNTGKIDGFFNFEPETLKSIKRPYRTTPFQTPATYNVFFNPGKNSLLKDAALRAILADAIDKPALAKAVFPYPVEILEGPLLIPREENNATTTATSSLDTAGKLSALGWRINENGVQEKQMVLGGKTATSTLEFTILVPQVSFLIKTANLLAGEWKKFGILLHVQLEPDTDTLAEHIRNRDYEMLLYGTSPDETGDLYPFWHSSQRFAPGLNFALYSNKAVDGLLEAVRQNGAASSSAALAQFQQILTSDSPALFLFSPTYQYITGNTPEGVSGGPILRPAFRFDTISEWFVNTKRVMKK